ncbi:MAG: formylglycine-generating enzyme family protein, partial [Thiotrichaceae bacterium]|nr:formylglycine-generating enzyme family protein [Thiotrichaceae bacterium]
MLENIEFQVLDLDKSEISLVDAATEYNDYSGDIKITDADWVDLPGGVYAMGSPVTEEGRIGDESLHSITINKFKMMVKAVTFDQYDQFCKATARKLLFDKGWGRGARPVINVSYWDAVDFAEWLSTQIGWACRMPTEAEWEYACRANSITRFCFGDSDGKLGEYAWYSGNSSSKTHSVGQKEPNAWGLYDMHGNV